MDTKFFIIQKLAEMAQKNPNLKILDFACGQSRNFIDLVRRYKTLAYVGVEPNVSEANIAKKNLRKFKNARIINNLAYDIDIDKDDYDVCISLSALEHIKNLDLFLKNSVKYTKKGGNIIHLYDLGHALYPHNFKAWIHVKIGNIFPKILPETQFVRYIDEQDVKKMLEKHGAEIIDTTYHQMPKHKRLEKLLINVEGAKSLMGELSMWEFKISKYLKDLPQDERERMFPSICIWAKKR